MSARASWLADVFPLTLGTAQLGMPYGRVVQTIPPEPDAADALFDVALAAGVNCFDTARNYQGAETLIGRWLAERAARVTPSRPAIVSKVHPFPDMPDSAISAYLKVGLASSLAELRLDALDGYLVHRASDFLRPGVADFLADLKADGTTAATGISIYHSDQLEAGLAHAPACIDFVQAPVSPFDRRLLLSPVMERAGAAGITLFARSVFLQGVLFMDPAALPDHLGLLAQPLRRLRGLAAETRHSMTALAIGATLVGTPVASLVIGLASHDELNAALDAVRSPVPPDVASEASRICSGMPDDVLDPRRWPAIATGRA